MRLCLNELPSLFLQTPPLFAIAWASAIGATGTDASIEARARCVVRSTREMPQYAVWTIDDCAIGLGLTRRRASDPLEGCCRRMLL